MNSRRAVRRIEDGAVAVMVAMLSIVLFTAAAFVTDFGMAYQNQRSVQNGADAAALAVGQRIALDAAPTSTCPQIEQTYDSDATLRADALSRVRQNSSAEANLAATDGYRVRCEIVNGTKTVVVQVQGELRSPTFFSHLLGVNGIDVRNAARVIVGPAGTVVGLRPFAICQAISDQVKNHPDTTFIVPVTNENTGCGITAGNWAMLDFDGGANPNVDMRKWIKDGYEGPVKASPPVWIDGDPGFDVNAAGAEMNHMMSLDAVALPVYDTFNDGGGNNAKLRIVGFITAMPCRYKINNMTGPAAGSVNPGCDALPASPPNSYIQLKFTKFIPVGELNLGCELATACDGGTRLSKLAD